MKQLVKTGFLFFFLLNFLSVKAQKHFVYVQSEDRQPFAIVMNGKVFSSSDYGYIIIPKLDDGEYKFTVSFPLNKFPDQSFDIAVNKKDAGYFLKTNNGNWALENMQTQQQLANNAAATTAKNRAFGEMLSDVVSDSTLTKTTAPPVADKEGGASTGNGLATATAVTTGAVIIASVPEKVGESKNDNGTHITFVDKSETGTDTIFAFIPTENTNADEAVIQNTMSANVTQDSLASASFQNTNNESLNQDNEAPSEKDNKADVTEKSSTDVSNPFYKPEDAKAAAEVSTTAAAATGAALSANNNGINNNERSDCENVISDDDLNKIKRKMFSQDNDDDMVKYALKSVSKKCITTDQVKVLGSLFSSDDGRYNLYDAMYKHVSDYSNYPTLANQILDPYYKKRFAALLR